MLNELQQHDTHFSFLMSRVTNALRIRKEIMNRGLINRSIVLSCESAMPGVISKPANYFTRSYSKTGLTLAAENLSHGAYAAIAAAVAAVAFLAWKIYRYFFKKETGEDPGKDSPSYKEVTRLNEKAKKITHEKIREFNTNVEKYNQQYEKLISSVISRTEKVDIKKESFDKNYIYSALPGKYRGKTQLSKEFIDELAFAINSESKTSVAWKMLNGDIFNMPAIYLAIEAPNERITLLRHLSVLATEYNKTFEAMAKIFDDKAFYGDIVTTHEDVERIRGYAKAIDPELFNYENSTSAIAESTKHIFNLISKKDREKSTIIRRVFGGSRYKEKVYPLSKWANAIQDSQFAKFLDDFTDILIKGDNSIFASIASASRLCSDLHEKIDANKKNTTSDKVGMLEEIQRILKLVRGTIKTQYDFYMMMNTFKDDVININNTYGVIIKQVESQLGKIGVRV